MLLSGAPHVYARGRLQHLQRRVLSRTLVGFVRNALGLEPPPTPDEPRVSNRFYPWDQSPSPELRERAAKIKAMARCPITGKEINYTCPISGIPTHHSREAWEQDEAYHRNKIPDILKKVNIYEHDLRSGRSFPEFDFPSDQTFDRAVNLANWDLYFYTRSFYSMDTEFQLATVTKMLSYPITIASVLHQYSPYSLYPHGPITLEGLKSIAALRYSLYPSQHKSSRSVLNKTRPMRIFILGARAESQLPGHVWKQFQYLFPLQTFEIIFIGPECQLREPSNSVGGANNIVKRIDDTISLVYHPKLFHDIHKAQDFFPYDPYNDVFFVFHPGFASPETKELWMNDTVKALLDTKCAVFHTGFSKKDLSNDVKLLNKMYGDKLDTLMTPVKNLFGSTKWELNDLNPQEVYQFNMYISAFRGKRYHPIEI
ncbi:hypothetical protein KAFR_0B00840 [Kazachstania africana CBS 2517]|uniref:Vps72/YL1 C-terminal domain-containing protein n=1 Tax=Kazachstania africana (strain ATCC 22294 / BCRC 22015 / CBS 2517 / CECT 1963 / NBRC 1671 / NRRL Y-8276) TaxID=1071382 RepID=H2APT2_KAZAF|nr:hypothetical protein KAFR_0B00840 [Kazachstania africana CBS 2517]CCF56382.1 hypothetical protein KAFR_0B00840 [Kazachstania africana CBS 2517]